MTPSSQTETNGGELAGSSPDSYLRCLKLLQAVAPYQYAQWLIEDLETHDYRVVASVLPEGEAGYDVAHRTGVIGQVFRAGKAIRVADARNHPLYDPFDTTITWELCFPVFVDGSMTAVVNLEGTGTIQTEHENWHRICEVVHDSTHCRPSASMPQADDSWRVATRQIVVNTGRGDEQRSDLVALARAIARGGESTLLVGHYPDLLRGRGPTMAEASQQGLGVSYCYFGVERRLDLLATGLMTQEFVLKNCSDWWGNCKGRYAFVLLYGDREIASRAPHDMP